MRTSARRLSMISTLLLSLAAWHAPAQDAPPAPSPLAADRLAALDRISSDSLKGHLSFIASDLLEGRDTPSRGLDLAAEYIAAQFRRAGLEAVGDVGYFQTASFVSVEPAEAGFFFQVMGPDVSLKLGPDDLRVVRPRQFSFSNAPLWKVDFAKWEALKPEDVEGKAVLVEPPSAGLTEPAVLASTGRFSGRMGELKAAAVLILRRAPITPGLGPKLLIDPTAPARPEAPGGGLPTFLLSDPGVLKLYDSHPAGPIPAKLSTSLPEPDRRPVKLRNVVGLLRGSDPALRDTYVMVTAHYDHVGVRGPVGSDRIYNGANDDGSGTVSVIELASALASLKERPKRSILFVTFFGEEKGLLGSRYYGRNPIIPVEKTVADVNLELVGRTDDSEGPRVGVAALTGFGYSDVSKVFVASGEAEGMKVVKHPRNSDAFFSRSDNQALADLGVPAHTLCVAFDFPDYHGAADHWDKVDYANMAKVDRMVARALLTIADDPVEPKWDESNPRAAKYLKAWKDRRGK